MRKILIILIFVPLIMSSCAFFGIPEVRFRQNMLDSTVLEGVRFDGAEYAEPFYVGTSTEYFTTSTGSGVVYCKVVGGTWIQASEYLQLEGGKNSIFISGTAGDFEITAQTDKKQ